MASARGGSKFFVARKITRHTCEDAEPEATVSEHKMNASAVARAYLPFAQRFGEVSCKSIIDIMKRHFQTEISANTATRAKWRVLERLHGRPDESYGRLASYFRALSLANPDMAVTLDTANNAFVRCFFAFDACIRGYAHCAPLLFLERVHLGTMYRGVLLAAAAVDAYGAMLPLAFAVVADETVQNWTWFLQRFKDVLGNRDVVVVSDRQECVVGAVEAVLPGTPHARCFHHLLDSFRQLHKRGILEMRVWEAAEALDQHEHEKAMQRLATTKPKAAEFFVGDAAAEYWAIAKFPGHRFGHMDVNVAEAFFNWIGPARNHPIAKLINYICCKLWTLLGGRTHSGFSDNELVPKANTLLRRQTALAANLSVLGRSDSEYEVGRASGERYQVNLVDKTCSCGYWLETGIPCSHAIAALSHVQRPVEPECKEWWKGTAYKGIYAARINLVDNISDLAVDGLKPPTVVSLPGRPKPQRVPATRRSLL